MSELEVAVIVWYKARLLQAQTKEALKLYRQKHGSCTAVQLASYNEEGYEIGTGYGPCYEYAYEEDKWCDTCKGSQPLYMERTAAASASGVALKALLRLCKGRVQ